MPAQPNIGTAIKRARERKRWTQRQLADALGVDIKTVDNWENGRTRPRSSIGALEEVLGVSLSGGLAREPGPLDGLTPWRDNWEAQVADDPDLPEEWKRDLIADSRAARGRAAERRRAARAARDRRAG